jgi:glycosyltransferase involved in cell wall biosynthesis
VKILFCVEFYYPSVGGAQEVVRQLAERMAKRGNTVAIATSKIASRTSDVIGNVKIYDFDVSGNSVRGMDGEIDRYKSFLAKNDADVVFFYAAQQWTFDAAWDVLPIMSAKKVLVPCGYSGLYDPAYTDYFEKMPKILAAMDAVVYHAESYRDIDFAKLHNLGNSVIIPNGADIKEFDVPLDPKFRESIGADESTRILLTVGTITGMKGHIEIAEAFAKAEFGSQKVLLLLNGNRPEQKGLRASAIRQFIALIRGYGMYYAIRHAIKVILLLAGFKIGKATSIESWVANTQKNSNGRKCIQIVNLKRPQLIQAFLQSDLFVFASNIEYSPLVLFEACAAGLPFLTVPVGNSKEIINWTQGGEMCDAPRDERGYTRAQPDVLARRIEELLMNPDRLKTLGRNGRHASAMRFNWDNLTCEYERVFQKIVTNNIAATSSIESIAC